MGKLHVVAIHGIGQDGEGYSRLLRENVVRHLAAEMGVGPEVVEGDLDWYEVIWSHIGSSRQWELFCDLYPSGEPRPPLVSHLFDLLDRIAGMPAVGRPRQFALTYGGDILVYLSPRFGRRIKREVVAKIRQVREHHHPGEALLVNVVAYSLGSVIAYDVLHELACWPRRQGGGARYLRDRSLVLRSVALSHLFTLGSPLALFSLMRDSDHHQYWRGIPFRCRGAWINFHDEADYLAYPVAPLFGPRRLGLVEDRVVDNGRWPFPLSHLTYWQNEEIAREIAHRLAEQGTSQPIS